MKNILLFGAGRSATTLIKYFLDKSYVENWQLTVADTDAALVKEKIGNHPNGIAVSLDINDAENRQHLIRDAAIVISMLPASLHYLVAKDCVALKKNLCTASYISDEIASLDEEAKRNGVLLMNECGLDPGIDHMSAMKIIDALHHDGKKLKSFKSYCGGLVAPENNDNPWGYKFTWNPRNVIVAGQGTARYIENKEYKYIPYNRLFTQTELIEVAGHGFFEGYANRDSLSYRKHYGLENIPTMLRGTLRQPGYCKAWDIFVRLGLTDDSFVVEHSDELTYAQLLQAFLPVQNSNLSISEQLAAFYGVEQNDDAISKVLWTGIAEPVKTGLSNATPAMLLQQLLEKKWKLNPGEKDMIVMQHIFEYTGADNAITTLKSSLIVKGDDAVHTAMSKTVGLPLAITAANILNGKINLKGVQLPVHPTVYQPVLKELESFDIVFQEQ